MGDQVGMDSLTNHLDRLQNRYYELPPLPDRKVSYLGLDGWLIALDGISSFLKSAP